MSKYGIDIETAYQNGVDDGYQQGIGDALNILKSQHMIRTYEDDFNASIEVPFYLKVYDKIKEQT